MTLTSYLVRHLFAELINKFIRIEKNFRQPTANSEGKPDPIKLRLRKNLGRDSAREPSNTTSIRKNGRIRRTRNCARTSYVTIIPRHTFAISLMNFVYSTFATPNNRISFSFVIHAKAFR